jgi:hypothetical protein
MDESDKCNLSVIVKFVDANHCFTYRWQKATTYESQKRKSRGKWNTEVQRFLHRLQMKFVKNALTLKVMQGHTSVIEN